MPELTFEADNELYSSTRDETPEVTSVKVFEPEDVQQYTVNTPPVTAAPEYQPPSDMIPSPMAEPVTEQLQFIPTVNQVREAERLINEQTEPDNRPVELDIEALAARYSEPDALSIIDQIEKGEPVKAEIVSDLIEKGIVTTTTNQVTPVKKTLIDRITNIVYNIIYN